MNNNFFRMFLGCLALVTVLFFFTACQEAGGQVVDDDCGGHGTLKLTNDSSGTVQQLKIDGVNYGTIDPGESKEMSLPAGRHTVVTINYRTGNYACSSFTVIIVECETESFSCGG